MKQNEQESNLPTSTINRRSFVKTAGFTGLGLAGQRLSAANLERKNKKCRPLLESATRDILNFALNLEYLEAEFYSMACYGAGLVKRGILKSSDETGPTTGGARIKDFGTVAYQAGALRETEQEHVLFLRSALGAGAAKKPAINLDALGYGFSSLE